MQGQNEKDEIKYVILTQKILGNKDLSISERIVLARISGFARFYESAEATAEFLGISTSAVHKAKQRLAQLNYIVEIGNTGRGKIYAPNLLQLPIRVSENDNQSSKICQSECQNLPTENKERIKKEYINDQKTKTEYGRADINELVDLWEKETGIDIKGQQHQRRQLYNLLKKYGSDATKTLVMRVGVASRSHDRFAPQIALPSDLMGKYGKLAKLQMWENRNKLARPFGSPAPLPVPTGIPDYNGAWDEQTDKEQAKVSEMMKQARKKLNI